MLDSSNPTLSGIIGTAIAPNAKRVDREGIYPSETMYSLGHVGVFAHHTGARPNMSAAIAATAQISAACLSTGFATWCQNALALYLDRSPNRDLHQRFGVQVASGQVLGGTGLSNPMKSFSGIEPLALQGERVKGGYRVKGRLPWVSNIAKGHLFAAIFAVEGNPPVMALIPVDTPGLTLHEATRFIALDGTATHTVTFRDVFVSDENLIAETASQFIPTIRQSFVALQLGLGFGLSQGTLDAMASDEKGKDLARFVSPTHSELSDRLSGLREEAETLTLNLEDPSREAFHKMLELRRDTALLTLDVTRAEAIQAGSRGYIVGAPSERRGREALFVSILTPSIKHIAAELATRSVA